MHDEAPYEQVLSFRIAWTEDQSAPESFPPRPRQPADRRHAAKLGSPMCGVALFFSLREKTWRHPRSHESSAPPNPKTATDGAVLVLTYGLKLNRCSLIGPAVLATA
jgi:hypothetical protein